jgi:transposase
MIRPDFAKWGQCPTEIRRLSIEAEHARSRERYQALYQIGSGQINATQWAKEIGRNQRTVLGWVHQYNETGPSGIKYQHSGGRHPLFAPKKKLR